jgi:monoamine oxidase
MQNYLRNSIRLTNILNRYPSKLTQVRMIFTSEKIYDAIVVGAGISGLETAKNLKEAGADVLVLEGRKRTDGRIHTDHIEGSAVDLGASWIHGIGLGVTQRD